MIGAGLAHSQVDWTPWRAALGLALPFAFISFFPIFRRGLRRYESAGNQER